MWHLRVSETTNKQTNTPTNKQTNKQTETKNKQTNKTKVKTKTKQNEIVTQLQMLLFPNALCCSLYECNCVCAVTKIFTKFLPANKFCQLLRVTRKRSCTSAGNAQAQLHFRDDQQRAFGISNISNWHNDTLLLMIENLWYTN